MSSHRWVRSLVLALMLMSIPAFSFGGVFVSVSVGPPPIPVYTQPLCPGPGYIWTPGYWAWGDDGYYWVPGTWVMAPEPGFLWTPGYWGWSGGVYLWHAGYWGPHVGFYGGVNYGFGYGGVGYLGGEWRGRNFYYNRSVNNVNVTNITNVYNKTVIVNNNHVSYNGGNGGLRAMPNARERQFEHERHMEATPVQMQHHQEAAHNPQMFARNNGGRPAIAATARPGDFQHAVPAKAAGGRVDRAALNANPRNMPANGGASAHGGANVPRPGNSAANGRADMNASGRNVPRPAASNPSMSRGNGGMNNSRGYEQQQRYNAPQQQRSQQHYNAPQQHSAPPQQHAAPQQHGGAQRNEGAPHEGKPHR